MMKLQPSCAPSARDAPCPCFYPAITSPPAIGSACPVTDCAPGEASHRGGVGDLLRVDQPALRIVLRQFRARLLRGPAGLRDDGATDCATSGVSAKPGQTALTVTPLLRELQRQRARQADDAVLGRAIGGDIGVALEPGGRGDVDDARACAVRLEVGQRPPV